MEQCKKNCIANINGECAVERCEGAISTTGRRITSPEKAAEFYKMAKEAFRHYFGESGGLNG